MTIPISSLTKRLQLFIISLQYFFPLCLLVICRLLSLPRQLVQNTFLPIHLTQMIQAENEVFSMSLSAAFMWCNTASRQHCHNLQLLILCLKYVVTAQSWTNFKEENLKTQQAEISLDFQQSSFFSLSAFGKKCLLHNYFLNFLLFYLLTLPAEYLQVSLISRLQFVAIKTCPVLSLCSFPIDFISARTGIDVLLCFYMQL